MFKQTIIKKNIKFMIFDDFNTIENFISQQIITDVNKLGGINISIESSMDFLSIFDILKFNYLHGNVSFRHSSFFMADEVVYSTRNWASFEDYSYFKMLDRTFFKYVDFQRENIHEIVNDSNLQYMFNSKFAIYDTKIDAKHGLDILVIKVHQDGSLIFNQYIDSTNLSSKGVRLNESILSELSHEFDQNNNMPEYGVTLGIDQILKARKIFLVASGEHNSSILSKLFFTKNYDKFSPLCLIKNHPNVYVLCDYESTKNISKEISGNDYMNLNILENMEIFNLVGPMYNIGEDLTYLKNNFGNICQHYNIYSDEYVNRDIDEFNEYVDNYNSDYQDNFFDDNYYDYFDNNNYVDNNEYQNGYYNNDYLNETYNNDYENVDYLKSNYNNYYDNNYHNNINNHYIDSNYDLTMNQNYYTNNLHAENNYANSSEMISFNNNFSEKKDIE